MTAREKIDNLSKSLTNDKWICPICKHQQSTDFEWCGKNLKCQCCGEWNYYQDWRLLS